MKHKVAELEGENLDAAVALAQGWTRAMHPGRDYVASRFGEEVELP